MIHSSSGSTQSSSRSIASREIEHDACACVSEAGELDERPGDPPSRARLGEPTGALAEAQIEHGFEEHLRRVVCLRPGVAEGRVDQSPNTSGSTALVLLTGDVADSRLRLPSVAPRA